MIDSHMASEVATRSEFSTRRTEDLFHPRLPGIILADRQVSDLHELLAMVTEDTSRLVLLSQMVAREEGLADSTLVLKKTKAYITSITLQCLK